MALAVAAGAGIWLWVWQAEQRIVVLETRVQQNSLELGKDYFLHISLIEVLPTEADGDKWDWGDGSAPDLFYRIYWKDTLIHESHLKSDTLIGNWSAVSVQLRDAVLSGSVSLDSVVDAAVVRVEPGGSVVIECWDRDLDWDDAVGSVRIPFSLLKPGENTFNSKDLPDTSIVRMHIRMAVVEGEAVESLKELM